MADLSFTVDTDDSTGDYASLNAWESAQQQDLTDGDGDTMTCTCQATTSAADTTSCGIIGWVTSATNDITIIAAAGHEAVKGSWDTARYRLETSNENALWEYVGNVNYENLQVGKSSSNGNYQRIFSLGVSGAANGRLIKNCRLKQAANNSYIEDGVTLSDTDCTLTIQNTIIYNAGTDAASDNSLVVIGGGTAVNIYNCTIFGGYYSIKRGAATVTVKNSIFGNPAVGTSLNGTITADYNCSEDSAGTNAQAYSGSDWDNELIASTTGNFTLLTGGNCESNGIGPSSDASVPTPDIDGTTRSGTTCDIGCDEIAAAGGRTTRNTDAWGLGKNVGMSWRMT